MQQVALPSLYAPRRRADATHPFPLVRPTRREPHRRFSARRFFAGLLFGVMMTLTLVLLGYEARVYVDQNPDIRQKALEAAKVFEF